MHALLLVAAVLAAPPLRGEPTPALRPPPAFATALPAAAAGVQVSPALVSLIEDVQVPALEAGALVAVEVQEGDVVQAGQLLARIDDRQPQLQVRAAELERDAALTKAGDDLEVRLAEATLQVADAELQEAYKIISREKSAITQERLRTLGLARRKSELAIERSKLDLRVAKMQADVHQAAVEGAQESAARRRIVSPIDGIVVSVLHERGEWVNAGEPVLQVVRMDRLRVEGFVSTADVAADEVAGRKVLVDVELTRGRTAQYTGQIVFVSPLVHAGGKYRVRAEVENRSDRGHWTLRPGMTAAMTILAR